jgi:hypothetical protein
MTKEFQNDPNLEWGDSDFGIFVIPSSFVIRISSFSMIPLHVRYLVKAKLKSGKKRPLNRAINHGSLGRGSIAGDEYLHNMREARVNKSGIAMWVETCFCDPPLAEERP